MHYFSFLAFALGFVSLESTTYVNAYPEPNAKPIFANRVAIRGVHAHFAVTATANGCTAVCWDLDPGTECDVQCAGSMPTSATDMAFPTDVTDFTLADLVRPADIGARDAMQDTVTVTVTSIPAYYSAGIFPTQASAALSEASEFLSSIALATSGIPDLSANTTITLPPSTTVGTTATPTARTTLPAAAISTPAMEQPTFIPASAGTGSMGRSLSAVTFALTICLLCRAAFTV